MMTMAMEDDWTFFSESLHQIGIDFYPFNELSLHEEVVASVVTKIEDEEEDEETLHLAEQPMIPLIEQSHSPSSHSEADSCSSSVSTIKQKNKSDDERKFECHVCGKRYKRKSSLATHRHVHTSAVKPFHCTQCDKRFLRNSDLKKHRVMHAGIKPYTCSVCFKTFNQSSNMLTHLRRHSGVRPFSCPHCGKSFFRKVDVTRHCNRHKTACHVSKKVGAKIVTVANES